MEDFMKKVLVTGAAGFIGKSLVKELIDRGTEVYAVVNNSRLDTSGIQTDMLHIIQCDLSRDTSGIEALEDKGIDVVYHLAWRGSYGPERCDISIQLGNVKMGMDCFKAAEKAGCQKFIAAGTISEFLVIDREPYGEWSSDVRSSDLLQRNVFILFLGQLHMTAVPGLYGAGCQIYMVQTCPSAIL